MNSCCLCRFQPCTFVLTCGHGVCDQCYMVSTSLSETCYYCRSPCITEPQPCPNYEYVQFEQTQELKQLCSDELFASTYDTDVCCFFDYNAAEQFCQICGINLCAACSQNHHHHVKPFQQYQQLLRLAIPDNYVRYYTKLTNESLRYCGSLNMVQYLGDISSAKQKAVLLLNSQEYLCQNYSLTKKEGKDASPVLTILNLDSFKVKDPHHSANVEKENRIYKQRLPQSYLFTNKKSQKKYCSLNLSNDLLFCVVKQYQRDNSCISLSKSGKVLKNVQLDQLKEPKTNDLVSYENQPFIILSELNQQLKISPIQIYNGLAIVNMDIIKYIPNNVQSVYRDMVYNFSFLNQLCQKQNTYMGQVIIYSAFIDIQHQLATFTLEYMQKYINEEIKSVLYSIQAVPIIRKQIKSGKVTFQNFEPNRYVVRNTSSWRFGNQDVSDKRVKFVNGKEVYLGKTMCQSSQNPGLAYVQWDNGFVNNYPIGFLDEYCLIYFNGVEEKQVMQDYKTSLYYILLQYSLDSKMARDIFYNTLKTCDLAGLLRQIGNQYPIIEDKQVLSLDYSKIIVRNEKMSTENYLANRENICNLETRVKRHSSKYIKTLVKFKEQYYYPQSVQRYITEKQLRENFMLQFAGISVCAYDSRVQYPVIVTIGKDWHHEQDQCGSQKLGILIPNRSHAAQQECCVCWITEYRMEIERLKQQALIEINQIFYSISHTKEFHPKVNSETQISFACHYYDAGKQNIFELSYYDRQVTPHNFCRGSLVGPGLYWNVDVSVLYGILVFQQNNYAIVFWNDGTLNRHRINAGQSSLVYLELW